MAATKYLICSDLDRTIIPNGAAPESPAARQLLRNLAGRDDVLLAYVSGRNRTLIETAIGEYDLPTPDYAAGDVGSMIYECKPEWRALPEWEAEISADWPGNTRRNLRRVLEEFGVLEMQEEEKQNPFKLSCYAPKEFASDESLARLRDKALTAAPETECIWSIDEAAQIGLLDLLPKSATKHHAVRFLMSWTGTESKRSVFAGDSGNDLPALTSGLQTILVANASDDVKSAALDALRAKGLSDSLYIAAGGFGGMNGNYAAGLIEGIAHFLPGLATAPSRVQDR